MRHMALSDTKWLKLRGLLSSDFKTFLAELRHYLDVAPVLVNKEDVSTLC